MPGSNNTLASQKLGFSIGLCSLDYLNLVCFCFLCCGRSHSGGSIDLIHGGLDLCSWLDVSEECLHG